MKRKLIRALALVSVCAMSISLFACNKDETNTTPLSEEVSEEAVNHDVSQDEVPQYEGYTLLWNDEFNGDTLNEEIWNRELREPGWTNNELQEYTASEDNIFVRDGHAVLKAIKTQTESGRDYYTSGKIQTKNKKDFMYGKIVISAKVPEGQGLWPALWMMPTDESYYGQWPKCGEIDIMEVLGSQTGIAYGTVHYGEPHAEQQGIYTLEDGAFANEFHEFSVEWEPGEMRWYIDGNLYHTANDWFTAYPNEDEKPYPAPFDQTFFIQMNLAVGGNWPGNPDETTDFENAEFEIDYVRVYQKDFYDTNVQKPAKVFREPLEDGNYIYNGDFSENENILDEENWYFLLFNGGDGSAAINDGVLTITTVNEGTVDYSVQMVQPDLPMIKGKSYRLTFDAYAAEERDMIVCVSAPNAGWIRYLADTKLTLGTDWKTYTYEFTMNDKDDNNGRLEFNMGYKGSTAEIYIDNVRLEEIE